MIPYSRPKRSDLYTLSQSKLLENHTLHSGPYLYSPYMAVPPVCYTAVFSVVRQCSLCGGALCDDAKNGCVADYFLARLC